MIKTKDEDFTMNKYFISILWDRCNEEQLLFVVKEILSSAKDNDLNIEWVLQELNKTKIDGRTRSKETTYYEGFGK